VKRRGSAMIFAIVMVVAITTSIMVTLTVTTNALQQVRRQENILRARYALEGAMVQAVAEHGKGTYSLPATRSYVVNGLSNSLTITDNSSVLLRTLSITGTVAIRGTTYTESRVMGQRLTASPFYYAIFVNNPVSTSQTITTGTSNENGDFYAKGAVSLLALSNTINGELESTSTVTTEGLTIAGSVFENVSALTMPTVNATDYSTASGVTTIGTSLNGYTFTTGVTGTQLLYAPTDLTLRGTFRNKGTIFVNGDVTVINSMSYFNSSSRLTVIATGSITFNNPTVVGYYFGTTCFTGASGVNVSRGGLAFNTLSPSGPVTVTNDPAVWNDPSEGPKMYLPGFYP
jgi:hypothetical protein